MNPILKARELGQSIWLDDIRRDLLESGELERLILAGEVCGVTSNPTIFEQAIASSDTYSGLLRPLAQAGWSHDQIFDALAIEDIREATDLFLPLYEATSGAEGFVSIEVNPQLAGDTQGTLADARRLWSAVNRPNVMIKIPATRAGLPAIEQAIGEGINVNVTLIFSLDRYAEVMEAFLRGLEKRLQHGDSLNHVASVASFFVSRVDTKVDGLLEALVQQEGPEADRAAALRGKIAIANTKLAYAQFRFTFGGARFSALRQQGALPQRPLWASTSTKNPNYPDTYYVDNLIGANTVNTVPPHTLAAFRDHGSAEPSLEETLSAARGQLEALSHLGLSIHDITEELEVEGVQRFAESYKSVLRTIRRRANELRKEMEPMLAEIQQTLERLDQEQFGRRLWGGDPTLWQGPTADEDADLQRGAWMTLPQDVQHQVPELHAFAEEARRQGLRHIVLSAMGNPAHTLKALGSVRQSEQAGEVHILDALDPAAVRRVARRAPIGETLHLAIDEPGFAAENRALADHFWERARKRLGDQAGKHFALIAGAQSSLASLAKERSYGAIHHSPAELRGGYAALSVSGLLPAVLMGVEVQSLLQGASGMARRCGPSVEAARNPGIFLGAVLGAGFQQGRRKLTIVADEGLKPLADWVGQLLADGVGEGMWPIVGEPAGPARVYGEDRLMVYLRQQGQHDRRMRGWVRGGIPVTVLDVAPGAGSLGAEFFRWQMATAALCHLLGLDPPGRPDADRIETRLEDLVRTALRQGTLPHPPILWRREGVTVWGPDGAGRRSETLGAIFKALFRNLRQGDALVLLPPKPRKPSLDRQLAKLQKSLRDRMGVAVSVQDGWEHLRWRDRTPRRSDRQVVYVCMTASPPSDMVLPSRGVSMGDLARARTLAGVQLLLQHKRLAYGVGVDSQAELRQVMEELLRATER